MNGIKELIKLEKMNFNHILTLGSKKMIAKHRFDLSMIADILVEKAKKENKNKNKKFDKNYTKQMQRDVQGMDFYVLLDDDFNAKDVQFIFRNKEHEAVKFNLNKTDVLLTLKESTPIFSI